MTAIYPAGSGPACLNRREFLLNGTGAVAASFLLYVPGAVGLARAAGAKYPEKRIARASQLETDQPVSFAYPFDDVYSQNILVKLGVPAWGGVGGSNDIVAFNTLCTHMGARLVRCAGVSAADFRLNTLCEHMGGSLEGKYNAEHKVLGACPLHLTTFDLRRHGMVVSGHGTQDLPQIVLKMEGDEIYATGIVGVVFGHTGSLMNG